MTLDPKALIAANKEYNASLDGKHFGATERIITAYLSTAPSGQAPLEGVKALDDELLEDFREDTEGDGECRFPKGNVRKLIAEIDRIRSALLPASAEPVGWQHRIYYEDIGKWSDWRDGKRNTRFDNEFEERPVYASPPASGAVEAGWQTMDRAPKDRLIDVWLSGGVRWCDCYYDQICDEWRTSRPSGHLLSVKAAHVFYWREVPAAPTEGK